MSLVFRILVGLSLLATMVSTLRVYPHQLAYFNELSGGPENGHKHLLGSNLDWGQDLLWVQMWQSEADKNAPCYVAYYGSFNPSSVGCVGHPEFRLAVESCRHNHDDTGLVLRRCHLPRGYYTMSRSVVAGLNWYVHDGTGDKIEFTAGVARYFRSLSPVESLGTIDVYYLPGITAACGSR